MSEVSYFDRVVSAFDPDLLARICVMEEEDFASAFDLEATSTSRPVNGFYAFGDRDSSVLSVAHLDTVADRSARQAHYVNSAAGPVIFSRALDDRLGAYVILDMLPKLGIVSDILLTVGEEDGESTGQYFKPNRQYNWMFEFDRGGSDVVSYQYEDDTLNMRIEEADAYVGMGSFSDISFLEHLECKGVNWGVGYQDYHGPRSHAFLLDTFDMVSKFLEFHENNKDIDMPHIPEPNAWTSLYHEHPEEEDVWAGLTEDDIRDGLYRVGP